MSKFTHANIYLTREAKRLRLTRDKALKIPHVAKMYLRLAGKD